MGSLSRNEGQWGIDAYVPSHSPSPGLELVAVLLVEACRIPKKLYSSHASAEKCHRQLPLPATALDGAPRLSPTTLGHNSLWSWPRSLRIAVRRVWLEGIGLKPSRFPSVLARLLPAQLSLNLHANS